MSKRPLRIRSYLWGVKLSLSVAETMEQVRAFSSWFSFKIFAEERPDFFAGVDVVVEPAVGAVNDFVDPDLAARLTAEEVKWGQAPCHTTKTSSFCEMVRIILGEVCHSLTRGTSLLLSLLLPKHPVLDVLTHNCIEWQGSFCQVPSSIQS